MYGSEKVKMYVFLIQVAHWQTIFVGNAQSSDHDAEEVQNDVEYVHFF